MKKFPKTLVALMVLALFIGLFSSVSYAAADLKEVRLTVDQLKVGYYNNTDLTGNVIEHCANSNVTKETTNLVDNKTYPYYWSKPYAFDDLKAYGGSKVPAILIDVANGGEGVAICGFEMQLREYMDCIPYWFEIQATTSAGSDQWVKVFEDDNTSWNGDEYHCEFDEVTVYKVRILFYDIGDADVALDDSYGTLPAGSTRFSLSEINLLAKREAAVTPTEAPTQEPTSRPSVVIPTQAPTEVPTQAPTQAPTAAPTQAPTVAPTAAPTEAPTRAPTQAPTAAPTQVSTQAPTQAATQAPTQVTTQTPVETTPTEPTEAPTQAPTSAPTEEPSGVTTTEPSSTTATQPQETEPTANQGGEAKPDNTVLILIIAIAAAAAIAGVCVFFIIKKKRG